MNANWARWVKASLAAYFGPLIKGLEIDFYIENEAPDPATSESDYVEMLVDGPTVVQQTSVDFILQVNVELIVMATNDPSDIYKAETLVGNVQSYCFGCIGLYKYGQESGDDQSFVDSFRLRADVPKPVRVTQYGKKNPKLQVAPILIEANYEVRLSG